MKGNPNMIKSTNHIRGGQNNKLKVLVIALSIMLMLLLIVQIQALLTSHDSKDNVFTMGNVTVTLTEPNWDQDAASAAAPNQTIDKDPTVNNTGANDAYVFVRVEVPIESDTELFALLDSTGAEGINTGWSLLKSGTSGGNKVYTYSYGTADALTALAPGSSTNPVFSKVKVASLSSYASSTYNLNVTAYAVQTTEVSNVPSAAWELVKGELGVVDGPTLINFTISGTTYQTTTYQAEEGMIWGEWVDSEYNTSGLIINSSAKIENPTNKLIVVDHVISTVPTKDVTIVENREYIIQRSGEPV